MHHRLHTEASKPQWRLYRCADEARSEQLGGRWPNVIEHEPTISWSFTRLLGDVHQHLAETRARDAIDERVMHFGEHSHSPTFEAVDEIDLPQRPRSIELCGHQFADEIRQCFVITGCGQVNHSDVIVGVNRRALNPPRQVDAERHINELPTELRHMRQTFEGELTNPLAAEPTSAGCRIDDCQRRHVHVPCFGFAVQKGCVLTRHSLHATSSRLITSLSATFFVASYADHRFRGRVFCH